MLGRAMSATFSGQAAGAMVEDKRPTFAEYLQRVIDSRSGLNGRKVATYTGLSANTISLWLRGATKPTPDKLRQLARGLNLDYAYLLHLNGDGPEVSEPSVPVEPVTPPPTREDEMARIMQEALWIATHRIPIQDGSAHAGSGGMDEGFVYASPEWVDRPHVAAIRIRGRCMEPTVRPGDVALIDPDADILDGDLVVAVHDEEIVIRAYDARTQTLYALDEAQSPLQLGEVQQASKVLQIMKEGRVQRD